MIEDASQNTLAEVPAAPVEPVETRREALEEAFTQAEAGTLQTEEAKAQRARDEAGRFAKEQAKEQAVVQPRPSTWKKEYWPLYDKLNAGQPLTPEEAKKLVEYTHEREGQYKTGVSTYKAEAEQARGLQNALAPYIPELQANGIAPEKWITSMAQAHYALSKGTPEQKLMVFQRLAQQFGVPVGAAMQVAQGQQVPQFVTELMQYQQAHAQQLNELRNWKQQQEQQRQQQEMAILNTEVSRFEDAQKFPHFEAVRETMAQLLERGLATDLDTAYAKACRLNDDIFPQLQQPHVNKPQIAAQAKARALSPRSATPSGQVVSAGPKDRRAALSEAFDAFGGGGRV